jgi:hypothetical protein
MSQSVDVSEANISCVCVDPALVPKIWPHVRGFIYDAIKRGDLCQFTPVEQAVLSGRILLWCATDGKTIDAAAVTELAQTEWRKVCVIVACGGNHSARWLHLVETIEAFARAEKCSALRIYGRKGWARKLPNYTIRRVVLEKEIA